MKKNARYIKQLEDFKSLLLEWEYGNPDSNTRSEVNKKLQIVRDLVLYAGALRTYTIAPPRMVGGLIMKNVDPFGCIFNPPYGESMIPVIIDSIDVTIGIIESNDNFKLPISPIQGKKGKTTISNRIFLVHGKDNELKESTARFLTKLELMPIILHEQTSKGRTIIEKFEDYSDVAFALVLMTPDDIGAIAENKENLMKRARQNVVFELGYFIGKLGRKNVVALVKGDIEIPSDLYGVVYIGIDNNDNWKMQLSKEIKAAGLNIDMNKI